MVCRWVHRPHDARPSLCNAESLLAPECHPPFLPVQRGHFAERR